MKYIFGSRKDGIALVKKTLYYLFVLQGKSRCFCGRKTDQIGGASPSASKSRRSTKTSMASRRNVHYSPLSSREDDDYNGSQDDPRFAYTPKSFDKVPWKSIALALFLLFLGSGLLFLAFFISTGHMGGDQSQAYGLLGLGILTFLPGFYETRIAYYSWRGAQGYRFASIPDY